MNRSLVRSMILLLVAVFATVVARAADPPAEGGPPGRVKIQQEVVDVGDVVRGQLAEAKFVLENTGSGPLHILAVKPGCGCTVASFDEEIAPGKTGSVVASMKTENFHGQIMKGIRVTTDDPEKASFELQVKANVVGSIAIFPAPRLALPAAPNWSFETKLLIRKEPSEKGVLNVASVATSVPWLHAKARKVEAEEPAVDGLPQAQPGDFVLDVSIAEDAPLGNSRQTVTFTTGLSREPKGSVPVGITLRDPIQVRPRALQIQSRPEAGKEATGVVSAVVRPGLAGPLKASASPDSFHVTVEPAGDRRYTATVSWKPGETAPKDGSLVLEIGADRVTVPVHVIVSSPSRATPAGAAR